MAKIYRFLTADVVAIAAKLSGLSIDRINGPRRDSVTCRVRFACFLIAREAGHSYPLIGRMIGDRDHSTVINGVEQAKARCAREPEYAAFVNELRSLARRSAPFSVERPIEIMIPPRARPARKPRAVMPSTPEEWDEYRDQQHMAAMRRGSIALRQAILAA